MNFEDFQKTWQHQDATSKISINTDLLLKEVRRKQQQFRRTIFWRDVREVGVAALLVPVFIHSGWKIHWTLYLCAFGCFVVGAFMLLDRWQQKKKTPDLNGSLKDCAATALAEVSHQIWLLKNILWWYLLPIFVPIMMFFGWVAWQVPGPIVEKLSRLLPHTSFVVLLYAGIYWLNQFAVRKNLEPRRQELEKLLVGLETENHPSIMKTKKPLGPLLLVLAVSIIAVVAQPLLKTNSATSLTLPFSGRWFVMQGGDTPNVNHHMSERAQWYAIDFMKVGGPGGRSLVKTDGATVEDYYSWGEPVSSPCEGEVVGMVNDLPDNLLGKKDAKNPAGNHVVIKISSDRYVFLAHFQQKSIQVKVGDHLKSGQVIGKCGNSGNSDGPHVHMHIQDTPTLNEGLGQNLIFKGINVELTGKVFEKVEWPLIRGLFVWR